MKNIKWSAIIISLLYIASGAYLFMYPQTDTGRICDVLGVGLIAMGAILILFYMLMDVRSALFRNDFLEGIILILIGGLIIYQQSIIKPLVYIIMAIFIVGSGVKKIQDAIDVRRIGYKRTGIYLIMAILTIAFGVVVALGLFTEYVSINQISGAGLVFAGVTDLFSAIYLSGKINRFLKELDAEEEVKPVVEEKKEEAPVVLPAETKPVEEVEVEPEAHTETKLTPITLDEDYDNIEAKTEISQEVLEVVEPKVEEETVSEPVEETNVEEEVTKEEVVEEIKKEEKSANLDPTSQINIPND